MVWESVGRNGKGFNAGNRNLLFGIEKRNPEQRSELGLGFGLDEPLPLDQSLEKSRTRRKEGVKREISKGGREKDRRKVRKTEGLEKGR